MSARSLTQDEAAARSALLSVDRYDIELDLRGLPDGPDVRAVSTIAFSCREPGAETFLDCAADVVAATLNGEPLAPAADGRLPLPGLAAHNTVRVETVQSDTSAGEGARRAVDPADGEVYLWTTFEPDQAHHVFACFDQPDLKAPHAFTVLAPAAWTVLSNSGRAAVDDVEGGRRWRFVDTPRLATYNTVVNAGPWYELRRDVDGYDLGLYARQSLASALERDADDIVTVTAQGLAFFGEVFRMPFPQRIYNQVWAPEFGGAMENFGCVTWSDASLRRTPPTPAEQEAFAKVLLHEMAHMWFGNIVTMRWWDDLWLNEAFAEFACNWAAARATRFTDAWAGHLAADEQEAYLADQGPISHPIRQPVPDVATAESTFDSITYPKGASVLQQLMSFLGEDTFAAGMAGYFARHQWGSTTLEDLTTALGEAGGQDLGHWRRTWLETAGTDRLSLEQDGTRGTLVAAAPSGEPRPHVLAIGAYRSSGGGLERVATVDVRVQGERTPVELPADADLLLVNDDDLTFASTRPAAGQRDAFFAAARRLPTPLSRGVAVGTVQDMLRTGEASAEEVARCLLAVLAVESSAAVVEPYLRAAADVVDWWAPDAARTELAGELAQLCRAMAGDDDRARVALRTYARVAPNADAVGWLRDRATDDVDLQWRALGRLAALGEDVAADAAALRERDPDPDAAQRALAVHAAQPDAAAKAAAWDALAVQRRVPIGLFGTVTDGFWQRGQADVLAPYADRYVEVLPELGGAGMISAIHWTRRLFPLTGIDEAYLDRVCAAASGATPVVRARVLQRADEVRRMLRARAAS
jgi:aminopeptidase N